MPDLGGKRQSVLEDVCGRALHEVDLNSHDLPSKTDQGHVIEPLP
jgi:hypothetical protein